MSSSGIFGAVLLAVGSLAILFHREFAAAQIRSQNQLWGLRMGARWEAVSRFVLVSIGLLAMLAGVAVLAGWVPMRR